MFSYEQTLGLKSSKSVNLATYFIEFEHGCETEMIGIGPGKDACNGNDPESNRRYSMNPSS